MIPATALEKTPFDFLNMCVVRLLTMNLQN